MPIAEREERLKARTIARTSTPSRVTERQDSNEPTSLCNHGSRHSGWICRSTSFGCLCFGEPSRFSGSDHDPRLSGASVCRRRPDSHIRHIPSREIQHRVRETILRGISVGTGKDPDWYFEPSECHGDYERALSYCLFGPRFTIRIRYSWQSGWITAKSKSTNLWRIWSIQPLSVLSRLGYRPLFT